MLPSFGIKGPDEEGTDGRAGQWVACCRRKTHLYVGNQRLTMRMEV